MDRASRREQLIAQRRLQPALRRKRPAPEPVTVTVTGPVSDLVAGQRR